MKIIQIIYDTIYLILFKTIEGTNKLMPEWMTVLVISSVQLLNVATFLKFINSAIFKENESVFILISFTILFFNVYYFLLAKRSAEILKKESDLKKNNVSTLAVYLYIILSFVALYMAGNSG